MEEKISPFRPHSLALHDSFISAYLTGYTLTGSRVCARGGLGVSMWKGAGGVGAGVNTSGTNPSLDALKKRSPRTLRTAASPVWDPTRPVAPRGAEALWLEPFPDSWLAEAAENPEARYTRHVSISLAFLTALQLLPPRQRAILLLSDVLDWRAVDDSPLLFI